MRHLIFALFAISITLVCIDRGSVSDSHFDDSAIEGDHASASRPQEDDYDDSDNEEYIKFNPADEVLDDSKDEVLKGSDDVILEDDEDEILDDS